MDAHEENSNHATFIHPVPPTFYPPPIYYYTPHHYQMPHAFCPPLSYPCFSSNSHNSTHGPPYAPSGYVAMRPEYTKRYGLMPPYPSYGPPPMQHCPATVASPVLSNQRRQDLAPTLTSPLPSSARGPPCKPKQSGWAVWVGNLPQSTTVLHLKDHFSIGAKDDIESVFLITKTNCAFVNYKTESACLEAIQRFDNCLLRGHRLVCRMRRDSLSSGQSDVSSLPSTSAVPSLSRRSSPASSVCTPSESSDGSPMIVRGDGEGAKQVVAETDCTESTENSVAGLERLSTSPRVRAKMFFLKSLTLQDLLVSNRDGKWMTQPHNVQKLNDAFHSAEDVYLIFSVNKSGQYFGYARMESPIAKATSPSSSAKQSSPGAQRNEQASHGEEVPRTIPTLATATAPEGYIIDDSARGTIFWEAKSAEGDESNSREAGSSDGAEGKHFSIRWISTT